jgi:hypothetical protein
MKRIVSTLFVMTSVLCLFAGITSATPFDPLFLVSRVSGDCMVAAPDSGEFVPVTEGKAYPYGTRVKTGNDSTAIIKLSEGNECHLSANVSLSTGRDAKNEKHSIIKLEQGKVEVMLEQGFQDNNKFSVETASAVCEATACRFTVEARRDNQLDLNIGLFTVSEDGTHVRIFGPNFEIPSLGRDGSVSVSGTSDRLFTRVKNLKATVNIVYKDSDGQDKTVELKQNSTAKISRKVSDGNLHVTTIITKPDGTMEEASTHSEDLAGTEAPEQAAISPTEETTTTTMPAGGAAGEATFTTSTTTSTTTTTIGSSIRRGITTNRVTGVVTTNVTITPWGSTNTIIIPTPTPVGKR